MFLGNNIIGDYMRKLWIIIVGFILFSGCSIANTPTSKVEDFLSKYQRLEDISLSYMQLSVDEDIKEEYKDDYRELMEKQYKGLSYEVKEEEIDGESAFITTEIKVYDYKEILDKYDKNSYGSVNEYHEQVINGLEEQKDKIVYTIVFELAMNDNDEWEVLDLSYDDQEKLLGIN